MKTSAVARALNRAANELRKAARAYDRDLEDLYSRVLTPGRTRLDRETRLSMLRSELERMHGLGSCQDIEKALGLARSLEREERGDIGP